MVEQPTVSQAFIRSLTTAFLHSLAPVAVLAFLLIVAPRLEAMFAELDVTLPGVTVIILKASRFFSAYWFIIPLPIVLFVGLDFSVCFVLTQHGGRAGRALWSGAVLLAEGVMVAVCMAGVLLPLVRFTSKVGVDQ